MTQTYTVELKLRLEVPATSPGLAVKQAADQTWAALLKGTSLPIWKMRMEAMAWEAPAELTNEHT